MTQHEPRRASARQILATLADLAPDSKPVVDLRIPDDDMLAVPIDYTRMFEQALGHATSPSKGFWQPIDEGMAAQLIKRAQLHDEEGLLRLGWLWVHGIGPDRSLVRFPLVSMPVRRGGEMGRIVSFGSSAIVPAEEPELTELVADPHQRSELESTIAFGGGALSGNGNRQIDRDLLAQLPQLLGWANRAAGAAGFATSSVVNRFSDLDGWAAGTYEVVVRVYLYLAEPVQRQVTIASTLRSWAGAALEGTAFAATYGRGEGDAGPAESTATMHSPLVLSPAQAAAVARARSAGVTVVSGPPGSGKTQTIAAIALDAVERGDSVLVAAPSEAAVEALITLMQRVPGPDPVVFGANQQRLSVADRLGQGGGQLLGDEAVDKARASMRNATETADALRDSLRDLLTAEQLAGGADPMLVLHARSIAAAWFESDASLTDAERLLDRARNVGGLFAGFRRRRREQKAVDHGGSTIHDLEELERALRMATAVRHSVELETSGGLDLTHVWPRLIEAEEHRRVEHGRWLNAAAHSSERVTTLARSTMGVIASALRAGRSARREKLGRIKGDQIADALPLWIGTLRDIDDLLPRTPGMFDIVIVDEASQVDQISAAPALLRAQRAVVSGDPKQLRHVSFLSDEAIAVALTANEIADQTDIGLLDVRRLSLFDLAAAAAPTILLDEHYRSAPHLIGFSVRHFYDGRISIATTHPRNHDRDCISVEGTAGARDDQGVNQAEIDRAIEIVRARLQIARSTGRPVRIGLVTPFRAQADAIEERVLEEFTLEEIDELALRVGTVHGFQGCERDVVVISLALTAESASSAMGFLGDPNLFNVMITRAREEIVVVTCLAPDIGGIVGDYIRYGSTPPAIPAGRGQPSHTVAGIAGDLERSGVHSLLNYPAGRHTLDLVLGSGEKALGVTFGVHPDGPDAHIERHIALDRAGWDIDEVFDTRWGDKPTELAVALVLAAHQRMQ